MTNDVDVIVLGLGRMGSAMVDRYGACGRSVVSWTRRGGGTETTADEAVRRGGPVVLALFDGRACLEVVDAVGSNLAGRLVLNTSTTGPDEAEAVCQAVSRSGGRYVHAPVLGSVPAVLAGSLRVLAGGDPDAVREAEDVLAPLASEVRHLGTVRDAAAAKLVANSSLTGAVLALRDALSGAASLGMPLGAALDVLELGRLGEVVRTFRRQLEVPPAGSHFTVGALAKDAGLVAAAGGPAEPAHRLTALVEEGHLRLDDDVSAIALPPAYARTVST